MNLRHINTFIWLRYRLRLNQLKRGGVVNSVLAALVAFFCLIASCSLFVGGFFLGLFAFRSAPPVVRLLVWDGLIAAFLLSWMIGLMTELQRTDALSLDKFLHLPVSPVGAFVINYVSSLFSLSLILFVPGIIGLILGEAFADGPQMLLAVPLLAAFVLAVTGLTYQFQGWLATLMTNPRRRRTVIVTVTLSFILIGQLPNLINLVVRPWESKSVDHSAKYTERRNEINKAFADRRLSQEEFRRQIEEADKEFAANVQTQNEQDAAKLLRTTRIINTALPPIWLSLGSADLAEGAYLPAMLGGLGLTLVGTWSLWRSYRTTLRIYTGQDTRVSRKATAAAAPKPINSNKLRLIEWQLPRVPERVSAVAVAAFRSILRAPETKMALIVPFIFLLIFGSMYMSMKSLPPLFVRPLMAFGAIAMVLLAGVQLVANQFGYDRGGFRGYVLSPIPRRDILLGKNLAVAPLVFVLIIMALIVLECFCPLRIDHFLASFAQAVSMFLLFCLLANTVSIITPVPMAAGALKPTQVKLTPVLAQLALMFLFPIVYLPLLIPIGIEALLSELMGITVAPIALPLTIVMMVGVVFIYRRGITLLGQLLSNREQKILECVTSKSE